MTHALVVALLLGQPAPAPAAGPAPAPAPTLSLDEALAQAEARNLDLKAARARLDQARELRWKAWSAYLPHLTAGATYTHFDSPDVRVQLPTAFAIRDVGAAAPGRGTPGLPGADTTLALVPTGTQDAVIQKQNQLAAQIQLTQALFAPQAFFGIGAAGLGEEVAVDSTEALRRQILFGVAQAYYGAASTLQVVAIQERQLAISLAHERDARVRVDAGAAPKVTLLRAEIDRARAEQDLKRAQNAYAGAKLAIATLLDRPDSRFEVAVPDSPRLPADLDALERSATERRPDVRAAGTTVRQAERSHDGVLARYAPTLGAFARWQWANQAGFSGRESAWALGLALDWALFDGGLRESDLREAAARVREAEATRDAARARALDEVRRGRLDLDSAVANREKAKEQLALARENQKLVDVNYRAGAATYLEVTDANAALLSAELTQVSEALNADLAALRVLLAAGEFSAR
jgi:outer membrane protein TolC